LIDIYVIGYVEAQDLKDKDARVMHNYHLASLKLLSNAYATKSGKKHMQDHAKGTQVV